jgi:hypothetical protein
MVRARRHAGERSPAMDVAQVTRRLWACDLVQVRRDHAFLIPAGTSLPFTAHGPVFRLR